MHAQKSESMTDIKYEDMDKTYNIVWNMNKLKLLCAGVDSNMNNFTLHLISLRLFT